MNAHNCSNKHFEWAQWKWKSTICHIFDQCIKNTPLLERIDKRENIQGLSFENFVFLDITHHVYLALPCFRTYFPTAPSSFPPTPQEKVSESSQATPSQSPVWSIERTRPQRKSVLKFLGNLQLACTCTCAKSHLKFNSFKEQDWLQFFYNLNPPK